MTDEQFDIIVQVLDEILRELRKLNDKTSVEVTYGK